MLTIVLLCIVVNVVNVGIVSILDKVGQSHVKLSHHCCSVVSVNNKNNVHKLTFRISRTSQPSKPTNTHPHDLATTESAAGSTAAANRIAKSLVRHLLLRLPVVVRSCRLRRDLDVIETNATNLRGLKRKGDGVAVGKKRAFFRKGGTNNLSSVVRVGRRRPDLYRTS